MNDDYLWNRSGQPDPDVVRLEHLLEPLRHRPRALDLSGQPGPVAARRPGWGSLAIAAKVQQPVSKGEI